jgi:Cd2+/Zn2+-exporting ATPase
MRDASRFMDPSPPDPELRDLTRSIARHRGVVGVHPVPGTTRLEIEYDPRALSEADVREIAGEHLPSPALQKRTLRLDGAACEACAIRLERRLRKLPGVRKATATYLGNVLCLVFDRAETDEATLLRGIRASGAQVRPYTVGSFDGDGADLVTRLRRGELVEETCCLTGFLGLAGGAWAEHVLGLDSLLTRGLYAASFLGGGAFGLRAAWNSLRHRVLDVDVLMVLAALGAAFVGEPFEGALLLFLFSLSNVLQRHALQRTRKAIHSLLQLRPDTALVKRPDGSTVRLSVPEVGVGDTVIVRPGEHVPVDGVVTEGSSHLDESSLTGESMPVPKSAGDRVFAGTLNRSGALECRTTTRAEDSTLSRMVRLVEESQAEKSGTQRFLEEAEQHYAAGVIALTAGVWFVPWLAFGQPFAEAFYRAMTVMVVASPCALVLSTPATVLSAIGGAARRGILIKGGAPLETASRVDVVAIDKTGTLTVGRPSVTELVDASGAHPAGGAWSPALESLFRDAAALEAKSEHPLAQAIVAHAADRALPEATAFQSVPGKGAEARVNGRTLVLGSERWFREQGAAGLETILPHAAPLAARGKTCLWIGERDAAGTALTALGAVALADTLRPEAAAAIRELRRLGVRRVVMLSGDQTAVAQAIGAEAGVDEVRAELLPEDKVRAIRELRAAGTVLMAGDGVNDAPALAAADLGVAMGAAGTDVAMETADVVLMGDRLDRLPELFSLARQARRVLRQNLVFATGVIAVLLAATFGFRLALPAGVVGHEGSTVLVCLNGLRLLAARPGRVN